VKALVSMDDQQGQLNQVLGRFIASLYGDLVREPLPDKLRTLVERLEQAERYAMHASEK
jgi:Anti-sigma factor NepR